MKNARELVVEILNKHGKGEYSIERIADEVLRESEIDKRDKRLVFEIVYGVVRNKFALDFLLKSYLDSDDFINNFKLMNILRSGAYQITYLDRIPDHAAVNESVILAKIDDDTARMSGVVNAVLRKIIRNKKNLPTPGSNLDRTDRLSITYSHPKWLIEHWVEKIGMAHTVKLLKFNNSIPTITARRKMRGLARGKFESEIAAVSDAHSSGKGYKNLYYQLKKGITPEELHLFEAGNCTIQAESSGWVVALLEIANGERVLDICSAPGGKSTLIAELAGGDGFVVSADLSFDRVDKVMDSVFRMNLATIHPVVANGQELPFNQNFRKVLLDVPCTGTGVMHRHPDARFNRKKEHIANAAKLQEILLTKAAKSVSKKGRLIYSTCSLEVEENFDQVKKFLETHPGFELISVEGLVPTDMVDENGCLMITPYSHGMDGIFGAILQRV